MGDNIDRAIRTMFLRRKLQSIEANRAEQSNISRLNKFFAQLKYPKTDNGRRRFIKNSLNPKPKTTIIKFLYLFIALIGLAGMLGVLVWTIIKTSITTGGYSIAVMTAIISMAFMVIGVHGFDETIRRAKQ